MCSDKGQVRREGGSRSNEQHTCCQFKLYTAKSLMLSCLCCSCAVAVVVVVRKHSLWLHAQKETHTCVLGKNQVSYLYVCIYKCITIYKHIYIHALRIRAVVLSSFN